MNASPTVAERDLVRARRLRQVLAEIPTPPAWAADLAEPLERLRDLTAEHAAARATLERLEAEHRATVIADRAAYGAARRAGKPAPGPKAVEQSKRALEDARRDVEGTEEATAQLVDEIVRVVEAQRPEWTAAAERAVGEAREACAAALGALVEQHRRLGKAGAWAGWLATFPAGKAVFRPHGGVLDDLPQPNGEPAPAEAVLGALAALYSGPPARAGSAPRHPRAIAVVPSAGGDAA